MTIPFKAQNNNEKYFFADFSLTAAILQQILYILFFLVQYTSVTFTGYF